MGRRGKGSQQAPAAGAPGPTSRSLSGLAVLGGVAAAIVAAVWWPATSGGAGDATTAAAEGLPEDGPLLRAQRLLDSGHYSAGVDALVAAQQQNSSSTRPSEVLSNFKKSFRGKLPRHVAAIVRAGIGRLEQVLYEELMEQGELPGLNAQLRLARLRLMHHAPEAPARSLESVRAARGLFSDWLEEAGGARQRTSACVELAQRLEGILQRRQQLVEEVSRSPGGAAQLARSIVPEPAFTSVDRRSKLSAAEYVKEYLMKRRPVIITDYADRVLSGGLDAWGWDGVRAACGDMVVQLSERTPEARNLWAGLTAGRNLSLSSWLLEVEEGRAARNSYLMDWGLAGRCDRFLESFVVPKYFAEDLWKRLPFGEPPAQAAFSRHPSLFAGAAGSGGALHVDSWASTFWQLLLRGRKRWTLYAVPEDGGLRRALFYAGVEHEVMPKVPRPGDGARAKREAFDKLPLLAVAEEFKVVAEVGPGEIMVVPYDTPHMVENLEDVLAVSMNVMDRPAVPRVRQELEERSCFSADAHLTANLRLLSDQALAQHPDGHGEQDVPWSEITRAGADRAA